MPDPTKEATQTSNPAKAQANQSGVGIRRELKIIPNKRKAQLAKAEESNEPKKPRQKTQEELEAEREQKRKDIETYRRAIRYSDSYSDNRYDYRHAILPRQIARWMEEPKLLKEEEWRALGVDQARGWEHYMIHAPEPHILLFRREIKHAPATEPKKNRGSEGDNTAHKEPMDDLKNTEKKSREVKRDANPEKTAVPEAAPAEFGGRHNLRSRRLV